MISSIQSLKNIVATKLEKNIENINFQLVLDQETVTLEKSRN
jgi:hypothetical protein